MENKIIKAAWQAGFTVDDGYDGEVLIYSPYLPKEGLSFIYELTKFYEIAQQQAPVAELLDALNNLLEHPDDFGAQQFARYAIDNAKTGKTA